MGIIVNGVRVNYNLISWLGADDLSTLTREEVCVQMLEPCLHDGPITLSIADFNLAKANVDAETIRNIIQAKIIKLGFKQICASIFQQLCPGYSDQPHAALEHIRQPAPGPDGQMVTASVIEYYQHMMKAARSFVTKHTYAISVCDWFIQGLDQHLLPCFHCMYQAHSTVHNLNGAYQSQQLPIILAAAHAAKDKVKGMQEIARGLLGQGFYSNVTGVDAAANPSQAKKTLSRYSGHRGDNRDHGRNHERFKKECFGCGGDHSWMKDKKIVCPWGTDPAIIRRASENYKKYVEKLKEMRARRSKNRIVDFKDMAPSDQKRMHDAILAIQSNNLQASLITASTSLSLPGPAVFMIQVPDATVLNTAAPERRILPVPIQPSFPHIILQLGQVLGCLKCPAIRCVVDTATALNTDNLHYYAAIAKAFPHVDAAIFSTADHNPIVLSGIVQQGGASITTNLTVAFQFHMPYFTHEGHPTTLLVACGPNVMVNTILGLPFIQMTRMVLDASNQVAELRALDTPPFAIDFRHAMCTLPPVSSLPDDGTAMCYADIIKEVNRIEAMYTNNTDAPDEPKPASILRSPKRSKGVNFDSAIGDDGSVISIGSTIKPKFNNDTDVSNFYDVHNSA
jgi:hypothetical protein